VLYRDFLGDDCDSTIQVVAHREVAARRDTPPGR
jgi:hypothetical protein